MGSSRLYQLSQILDVPVPYFFDDMPPEVSGKRKSGRPAKSKPVDSIKMTKRETLELVRAYYRIQSARTRAAVHELIEAAAGKDK